MIPDATRQSSSACVGFRRGTPCISGLTSRSRRASPSPRPVAGATAADVFAVVEITAGQGSVVGYSFAQLGEIMNGCSHPERLAVCIDTCHTFAAGYDFRTREGYDALLRDVEGTVGLSRVRAFHLNDSKGDLGSRADRHEDIGKGKLGQDPLRYLLNDERVRTLPAVLEFPDPEGGYRKELKLLRSLVTGENPPTSPQKPRGRRAGRETG